jgi:hypothetical protein
VLPSANISSWKKSTNYESFRYEVPADPLEADPLGSKYSSQHRALKHRYLRSYFDVRKQVIYPYEANYGKKGSA